MHDRELKMDGTSQVIECSVLLKSKTAFLKKGLWSRLMCRGLNPLVIFY